MAPTDTAQPLAGSAHTEELLWDPRTLHIHPLKSITESLPQVYRDATDLRSLLRWTDPTGMMLFKGLQVCLCLAPPNRKPGLKEWGKEMV